MFDIYIYIHIYDEQNKYNVRVRDYSSFKIYKSGTTLQKNPYTTTCLCVSVYLSLCVYSCENMRVENCNLRPFDLQQPPHASTSLSERDFSANVELKSEVSVHFLSLCAVGPVLPPQLLN